MDNRLWFHSKTEISLFLFFKTIFWRFYLSLERREGKEKERERNIIVWLPLTSPLLRTWPATLACALTGNWTSDPLVLRSALNPLSHTNQGRNISISISKPKVLIRISVIWRNITLRNKWWCKSRIILSFLSEWDSNGDMGELLNLPGKLSHEQERLRTLHLHSE